MGENITRRASIVTAALSRRGFIAGSAAAAASASVGTEAKAQASAQFRYRLGLSQPLDSPNALRLQEMADKVQAETGGRMLIEVHAASTLGSDNAMLDMVQKNALEMYLGGNVFGPLVPTTEMPGLPFIFKNSAEVFAALDGKLGDYIRSQMLEKGLYTFRRGLDNGFHQFTTRTKPIRNVGDLVGMTIRTPVQVMTVDFFETLGAKPVKLTLNQLYAALHDRVVDGQTDPLGLIWLLKLYEVQTYLSLSSHWWSGFTLVANAAAWQALPADFRAVVEKHAEHAALAQRRDIAKLNGEALGWLRTKGMIVNKTDTSGFKKPLGAFYARWKQVYGAKAWALLEARTGKLV
jgi:tripartite ATP-independent transporter DctP family solute receptor